MAQPPRNRGPIALIARTAPWRIESRDWLVSSYTYPAPAGLVAMGHMMNFQIGLGPHHVTLTDNSGLCTVRWTSRASKREGDTPRVLQVV
eukprot:1319379-Prymnesium_polylepis.1